MMTGTVLWVFGNESAGEESAEASRPAPSLKVDDSPVQGETSPEVVSYADMLEKATPSVVGVVTTQVVSARDRRQPMTLEDFYRYYHGLPPRGAPENDGPPDGEGDERREAIGMGSGVIVSPEGYVLTNNHVVRVGRGNEIADQILVQLSDGREFEAELVGTDEGTDVAILKIDAGEPLPAVTFADSEKLRVGDVCFAIGNPLGVGLTVTRGIVSAMDRSIGILRGGYEDFIQTDAAINMGNSGGALIDAKGRLIGINTAILSRSGGNIGIGFAIPANMARYVMESLIEKGEVPRGFLGVVIGDLSPELAEAWGLPSTKGALIRQVQEGSAAAKAGLMHSDVIIDVDGHEIDSATELRLTISQIPPNETVNLTILRNGEEIKKEVVLGSLGDHMASGTEDSVEERPFENMAIAALTPELRAEFEIPSTVNGVLITDVERMTQVNQQFRPGMVISEVNRVPVTSVEEVSENLRDGQNSLYVWFDSGYDFLTYDRK